MLSVIADPVGHLWGYANAVPNLYFEFHFIQHHPSLPSDDVIDLFREVVQVQPGTTSRRYRCLCQALVFVSIPLGVHQFPDQGAIFGPVRFNFVVVCFHRSQGNKDDTGQHQASGNEM